MKARSLPLKGLLAGMLALASGGILANAQSDAAAGTGIKRAVGIIRTPVESPRPKINGAGIFGVRPGHPFFYHMPVTGDRPVRYSAENLPAGLTLDSANGNITGMLPKEGAYSVMLHAANARGTTSRPLRIVVGESIALTPAMGWNSWNHYGKSITQAIVIENAKAMAQSGLIDHGWSYINIDDGWQGPRGGAFQGLQGNEKFPDMKAMCDEIHAMGLRFGLYSTPWTTSYADFPGSSAMSADGSWTQPAAHKPHPKRNVLPYAIGAFHFAKNDARQWAAWGVDYLKYDWNPIELPESEEMYQALRRSGRDILFSLSNHMKLANGPTVGKVANSWRTTGDIMANWKRMSELGFGQDSWKGTSGPGHWIDPDMLEIATAEPGEPGLLPDEEYTHMTLWCLLSAPLLVANDLSHLDAFTRSLLTNDEVIAIDQDSLGDQAVTVAQAGEARVYCKKLEDGSLAVGLFNTGSVDLPSVTVKWSDLGLHGDRLVRDLWRQKDLGVFPASFSLPVAAHGAELVRITPARP